MYNYDEVKGVAQLNTELAMPTIYSLLLEYKKEVDEYSKGYVICDIASIIGDDDARFRFRIHLRQKNNIFKYYIGQIKFYSFAPMKIDFWIPTIYFPRLRGNDTITTVESVKKQLALLITEQKIMLDNLIELTKVQELSNIDKNETVVES